MLCRAVDEHLASVEDAPRGDIVGLVAPHVGLVYSEAVAAYAYQAVAGRAYDVVVLVGPSHHVEFEGVVIYPRGWFDTPLGDGTVSTDIAEGLLAEYERYLAYRRGRSIACEGGALVAVMRAVARLGAKEARVLRYADSGDVSGEKGAVVGYLAAALGRFVGTPRVSGQTGG